MAKRSKTEPADPNVSWSFELPTQLKCAIADCVTTYSKIESCIVETVWVLEQADLARKKEIAKAWGDQNLRVVKGFIKALPGAETDAIWPMLNLLRKERNLIAHGVWMVSSDGRPMVIWHSKFLEDDTFLSGEYFDWHRFERFTKAAGVLLRTFAQLKTMLESAAEKPPASLA